jgi:ribonuclease P protein component
MPRELRHGRQQRLRLPQEFKLCFAQGQRVNGRCFRLHVLVTNAGSRLGLAVSRKVDPHAVGRNRIKRQARESFRSNRASLPTADYVLVARQEAAAATNAELRSDLERLWTRAGTLKPAATAGTMHGLDSPFASTERDP